MLRYLADENFNNNIVRGLLRRQPDLDIIRVQDADLSGAEVILEELYPTPHALGELPGSEESVASSRSID
jgi:hypothetical protein